MNIKIQSVHFDADKKLLEFIESRLIKLEHMYNQIVGAEVVLKVEKSENNQNKAADIRIMIPGNDLFAKRQAKTFEEAVDLSIDAAEKQLKKVKEKLKK